MAAAERRWRDAVERDARDRQNERIRDGINKISKGFA